MIFKRTLVALAFAIAGLTPAAAQFADQATWAGTGAGSANAQTITVANASSYSDLLGVLIKFVPGATNGSGGMTLGVTGLAGGAPSVRRPTTTGPSTAMLGNEFVTGQPVVVMYDSAGYFDLISVPNTTTSVGANNLLNSTLSFGVPVNLQLNATVGSNNLTIAVEGNNGSDPSATNPVLIPFRDVTIASGDPVILSLQGALSFTINSSNTMGCISGQMCRLWIVAINNASTVSLCAFNALSGTNIAPINEGILQTSAAGTNGGSSAQTYYCNASAVTAKAIRILGYVEISEVTAGTWATGPTYTQLFGPGIKKPGDIVQVASAATTTNAFVTSATFVAFTNGQTQSITPTSAANLIRASSVGTAQGSGGLIGYIQFTRTIGASTTAIGSVNEFNSSGATANTFSMTTYDVPNTTLSVTYGYQGKTSTAAFNYPASTTGVFMELQEIMGSLEPANDNGLTERRMVG